MRILIESVEVRNQCTIERGCYYKTAPDIVTGFTIEGYDMTKTASRKGMVLKPEYQEVADAFDEVFGDSGCTCIKRPPCNYCTHEGNPLNLEENDDAWEPE